ncbi:MAG TPA: class I SAM-dependent methyltransferase [Magnetospirillaceae bacterium]|nr:class I SAM-dependent methyltransferase [Magnetospirillaceae bacterium]
MFQFLKTKRPEPEPEIVSEPEPPAPPPILVPVLPGLAMRDNGTISLNRLPDISDWRIGSRFSNILGELNCGRYIHRKDWEYGLCIEGLEKLGVVHPDAQALAVGAGYERPLFYFANKVARMVATDLYDNPDHEGKPAMLTQPWSFSPIEYRRDRLEVLRMPGNQLEFPDDSFDFLFCLSSIEHFGSREIIRQSLDEMKRVLKPGGIACVITELILQGPPHHEYFQPDELTSMFLSDPTFPLVGGEMTMNISQEMFNLPVSVLSAEDLTSSPHIVLSDGERLWTSASMFLRKPN